MSGVNLRQIHNQIPCGGKSADAQQGNQQTDSAVKDQHKEDCRRLPRQMELARQENNRSFQQIGYDKCDHKGRQHRQPVLKDQKNGAEQKCKIQKINDKGFLFFHVVIRQ